MPLFRFLESVDVASKAHHSSSLFSFGLCPKVIRSARQTLNKGRLCVALRKGTGTLPFRELI